MNDFLSGSDLITTSDLCTLKKQLMNIQKATKVYSSFSVKEITNTQNETILHLIKHSHKSLWFQFHMLAQNYRAAWLELYKNGDYIESIYGHNTDDYASGGNSVILHIAQGDQV